MAKTLHSFSVMLNWATLSIKFQDYKARLSDFGLAKDGPEGDDTHVSTRVMGTHGYAAPEYIMTGESLIQLPSLFFVRNWFFISSAIARPPHGQERRLQLRRRPAGAVDGEALRRQGAAEQRAEPRGVGATVSQ